MAAQASQLVHLPRELLDRIASCLPTLDFNSLRLSCKDVEAKLFKYWSSCFFKKRQFSKQRQLSHPFTTILAARKPQTNLLQ